MSTPQSFDSLLLFFHNFEDLISLQALIALKKGSQLLKYGRKGKPKFCPFSLSNVSLI